MKESNMGHLTQMPQRFQDKVKVDSSGCWVWTASKHRDGYGWFRYLGGPRLAHTVSYEILRGGCPKGLELDHLCRNRSCVNPWHLEPVKHLVNVLRGEKGVRPGSCPQGHPYPENLVTYVRPRGQVERRCRICRLDQQRQARLRAKERAAERMG